LRLKLAKDWISNPMATIPTPLSYAQILGQMMSTAMARGIPGFKKGDALLSILEAAAQSDLRSSKDLFAMLAALDLGRAKGLALDRIGLSEGWPRLRQRAASDKVVLGDSSFTPVTTRIFQGGTPPVAGSTSVVVEDASVFPATPFNIYIGRGTTNTEGPLTVTLVASNTLTLSGSTPTQNYHNLGETVTLAQGGDRVIPAGTIIQTPQGATGQAVQFRTLFPATIPDGELSVTNVPVAALVPGTDGNVPPNSISEFVNPPFSGATVTNLTSYSNGRAVETDDDYRDRIRRLRQSRSKGTPVAIETAVLGAVSPDDNRQIVSASVQRRTDGTVLYVDDGTGYEEESEGMALEILMDSAIGGEKYFALTYGRPVTQARVVSTLTAPFSLVADSNLAVQVGGVLSTHSFDADSFGDIANATAYEVTQSINANPALNFSARTIASGTKVAIFAKDESNDDIQVVPAANGDDANDKLGFPTGLEETLALYVNDRKLFKDGRTATVTSLPQGSWSALSSGVVLNIEVDGITIPTSLTTVVDLDFQNAGTPYSTVSETNSLDSWAQVLNYKIPGITATVSGASLLVTSNRGRSGDASINITGGTLGTAMFGAVSATGRNNDYVLDRNLGLVTLEVPLAPGDTLTAGSIFTRAFVESTTFPPAGITIAADVTNNAGQSGAELWVVPDGQATVLTTGMSSGTVLAISLTSSAAGIDRVRIAHASLGVWDNAQAGDWVILQDSAFSADNRGAFRIAEVDSSVPRTWIEIERPSAWNSPQTSLTLAGSGLKLVHTDYEPQRVYLAATTVYTPSSLASAMNSQLKGATAVVYKTTRVRLRTNSSDGDIAVVASNLAGLALGFPVGSADLTFDNRQGSLIAAHAPNTPSFTVETVNTVTSQTVFDATAIGSIASNSLVRGLKSVDGSGPLFHFNNKNHVSSVEVISGTTVTLRDGAIQHWLPADRVYAASPYAIGPNDTLSVVLDEDQSSKQYSINMFRKVKPGSATYGISNDFKDMVTGSATSLTAATAFGASFDFKDFTVLMQARTKTHPGSPDTTKTGLWRYYRHGPEGNSVKMSYGYSNTANAATSLLWVGNQAIVRLPTGAARSAPSVRNTTQVGFARTAGPVSGLYTYTAVLNISVATAIREIRIDYTLRNGTAFAGTVTGSVSGATATVSSDSNGGGFPVSAGHIVVTGVAGAFIPGEPLTTGGGTTATAATTALGYTTLDFTGTMPTGVTDHGLSAGQIIYLNSTSGSFASGPKQIYEDVALSTIRYIDVATTTGLTVMTGSTISLDPAGEATLAGSAVVNGDLMTTTALALTAYKLQSIAAGNGYVTFQTPSTSLGFGGSTVIDWRPAPSGLTFFPIGASNTISNIVTAVNAIPNTPITGVAVGDGTITTGTITNATYEAAELGGTDPWYYFSDGINWVRSQTVATDYNFTFKNAVTANLATNSKWDLEDVRLVPSTPKNVVEWLSTQATGGLFSGSSIELANGVPQITTSLAGSRGSVRIEGGNANQATAPIVASAALLFPGVTTAYANTSDLAGFMGGMWVRLANALPAAKAAIGTNTQLTSIDSAGLVTLNNGGTAVWTYANSGAAPIDNTAWQIEKQGDFVAFVAALGATPTLTGVSEGDWVEIQAATTPPSGASAVNSLNRGVYRVVRVQTAAPATFWLENASAVEELGACKLRFLTYDSMLAGDSLVINSTAWGVNNTGAWRIKSVSPTDRWSFTLDTADRTPTAQGTVGALGTEANLFVTYESAPTSLIKKLTGIMTGGGYPVIPTSTTVSELTFSTTAGYKNIGPAYGTTMQALDKLAFPVALNNGQDGYLYSTGLIAEANKIVYGSELDSTVYPGVAAAGAKVDISGPLVRRVQVGLALRATSRNVEGPVRAAVASVVNQTGIGGAIALGNLVAAAQNIPGVTAATLLSPTYGPGNDVIQLQPGEKALVTDASADISIVFVGE
jgi:hypothetical protein